MERTDTTGIELKPKGHYILEIERVIKSQIGKEGGQQYPGYKWYFKVCETDSGCELETFDMFMFKSQMTDILRAIGAKEVKDGIFEWELEQASGALIDTHMAHVEVNGKMREQLIETKAYDGPAIASKESEEPTAWDS